VPRREEKDGYEREPGGPRNRQPQRAPIAGKARSQVAPPATAMMRRQMNGRAYSQRRSAG